MRQFPPAIFEQKQISIDQLQQTGLVLEETTYLTVGGGMGSFTWVDHLLIHGVDPADIAAIGFEDKPYARCQRLCRNSQIPDHERLRSDSGATLDNIWGWPGYAIREIWRDIRKGRLLHAGRLAWQIFSEPVLAEPFTPIAADTFAAIDREAQRIGWDKIWRFGRVRAIRQTTDGRYVIAYSQSNLRGQRPCLMLASYLHLAVGYPRLQFLPDLQYYREQTADFEHFVNAYEQHDHVYETLQQQGGTVLLRGRGIVASRVIQRLFEVHCQNKNISIVHLMRSRKPGATHYKSARRLTRNHFDHQHFNFPKSSFGGDFRFDLALATDKQRAELIDLWGGVTTSKRQIWEDIIETGLREGWYQIRFGEANRIERTNGKITATIAGNSAFDEKTKLHIDYIIDATGLDPQPEKNPLLCDLLHTYQLPKNSKGQLKVSDNFEIEGLQHKQGRVYASGIISLGGPFAPVDSFMGLQYAAQRILDDLISIGAPNLHRLNPWQSLRQWLRWARGKKP